MPGAHSVMANQLGDGADALVAAAREMPQLATLCGIQPEQEDVNFSGQFCNIVYARFSALNDVQRRPSKSRHALALFHCLPYLQRIKSGGTLCI